jgi:hypothetical protein
MSSMAAGNAGAIETLATDELDAVVGGSIFDRYVRVHQWINPLDLVSLNPQPLPPRSLPAGLGQFGR